MPWLFLVLAVVALIIAFKTTSLALLALCLLASLALIAAWVMALLAERVGRRARDADVMLNPGERGGLR